MGSGGMVAASVDNQVPLSDSCPLSDSPVVVIEHESGLTSD